MSPINVSVVIPAQASESAAVARTLDAIRVQSYDEGAIEVFVVQYGDSSRELTLPTGHNARILRVESQSPYVARNLAAREANGDVLAFTEPGCIPEREWVSAHVAAIRDERITMSVGHVAPSRETWATRTFQSYENARDAWVFGGTSWQHLFGRPKNMAIARHRFVSHGPFAEVIRGADSKLVQLVGREVSVAEIGHSPSAIVRQETVRGWPSLLGDRFRHARALAVHRSSHAAPIALDDRVKIFRGMAAERGYGAVRSGVLLMMLAAGIVAFRAGGASARFR